jgi:hypothetical protein
MAPVAFITVGAGAFSLRSAGSLRIAIACKFLDVVHQATLDRFEPCHHRLPLAIEPMPLLSKLTNPMARPVG